MGVADNIRRMREGAGMTQAELAERVGRTRATVTQWESGWSQPRMSMVVRLAEVFGVKPSDVIDDAAPDAPAPEEARLLALYRAMDANGKEALLAAAEGMAAAFPREADSLPASAA